MWTIALEVRTKGGLITKTINEVTFTRLQSPSTFVEVLYDQKINSVEWALLELLDIFYYVPQEISHIAIIKSWKNDNNTQSDGYDDPSESSGMG